MIVSICTIIALLLACVIISCVYEREDIFTIIVQGIVSFLMCYAVVSSIYLMFNRFTIIKALISVIIIEVLLLGVIFFVFKWSPTYSFDYRKSICPVLIFLAVIPFLMNKNGYLGVGQDAGVYQTRAIAMINGYFDNYFTFEEYDDLTTYIEKQEYLKDLDETLTGYYITTLEGKYPSLHEINDTTGILHGIHAYSAILALVGTIFGMSNMMYTGALFMFCTLYILYAIFKNLHIKMSFRILGLVLLSFSPPVLWLFKTTLSETFLILLITEYVYFITDRKHSNYMWLSALPVITYAFFHVSIYVLMPMFVFIYYLLYVMTRKPLLIISNIAILIGYYAGFRCMLNVSSGYTKGNYKNLYVLKFINNDNLITVITVVTLAAIVLSIALYVVVNLIDKHMAKNSDIELIKVVESKEGQTRKYTKTGEDIDAVKKEIYISNKYETNKLSKKIGGIIGIVVRIVIVAGLALTYLTLRKYTSFEYTSAYAYVMATGVFLVPIIFLVLLLMPKVVTTKKDMLVVTMFCLYEYFLYSIMFIPYIGFYYYYARYIIIHIPVILVVGMYLLNSVFKTKALNIKVVRRVGVFIAVLFVLGVYKPYDIAIAKQQDQTSVSWETLESLANTFTQNDAIVMSQEWSLTVKLPLKLITKADIYPVVYGYDMQQMDSLRASHKNVYLMTEKSEAEVQVAYMSKLTNICTINNEVKYAEVSEDTKDGRGKYIPFVTAVAKNIRMLYIYK